jgi:beta-galactosidase
MKSKYFFSFIFLYLLFWNQILANGTRQVIPLLSDWTFVEGYEAVKKPGTPVNIPHTWNLTDAGVGKLNYYRGLGIYRRKIDFNNYKGKRVFIRFEGVNSKAEVYLNNRLVGTHEGGYTAFAFELTSFIEPNKENELTVKANNSYDGNIPPLIGDFNFYGGIHRPVSLVVTSANCIDILDYASPGVYLIQKSVTHQSAEVDVKTKLSIQEWSNDLSLAIKVLDHNGQVVIEKSQAISKNQLKELTIPVRMHEPTLWNGKINPYLYQVEVALKKGKETIDLVVQPLGLRFFQVDKENGFFLNGNYLDLYGACRHEDVFGKGSALTQEDHELDMALINELGATTIRLTHYPHSSYFYELLDQNGIVTWTEIPLVGPGGYAWQGFTKTPQFFTNAKNVLLEMIRQNYNHPSIFFWGLYNELKMEGDSPVELIKELNKILKEEDPYRLSVAATFVEDKELNNITDLIAWNKYYGWYGGDPSMIGIWADKAHKEYPKQAISVSEYGAGASIQHHEEVLVAPTPTGKWHPEGWQAFFHEEHWKALAKRPFVWSKHIWLLHDFSASHRTEGDRDGINDKGLVTYDRQVKKDAFYFYKANWNKQPMIYLTSKRFAQRKNEVTEVKVYSNTEKVTLEVNGKLIGVKEPDEFQMAVFKEVNLQKGKNIIKVIGVKEEITIEDVGQWFYH